MRLLATSEMSQPEIKGRSRGAGPGQRNRAEVPRKETVFRCPSCLEEIRYLQMFELQSKGQPFSDPDFPNGPCPHCGIRLRYTKAVKRLIVLVLLSFFFLGFFIAIDLLSTWFAVILAIALPAIVFKILLGVSVYEVVGEEYGYTGHE